MANKKVSQLTSKPSVLTTDLFPIADPSTGQLYKTTISDLGTAIGSGVSSVNGLVGAVVLDTDDIQELVSPTNKWFTDTRARAALSASSPLTYNSGTGAFGIQVANGSQNGYLSSTDWTTFNSKQAALSGTGFVKISGTTISYDNSTYLTTSAAASTYLALTGGTLTGALNGTSATFTGDLTLSSSNPRLYLTDTDNNPDYFISNTDGTFTIYDVTNSTSRFTIGTTGNGTFGGNLTVGQIIRSGGTSSQFLKADGSVDSTGYLPLAGGTLTGALFATSASFSGYVGFGGNTSPLAEIDVTGAGRFSSTITANGATLTGALSGTSASFSSSVTASGTLVANAGGGQIQIGGGSTTSGIFQGTATNNLFIGDWNTATKGLTINVSSGAATFSSSVTASKIIVDGASNSNVSQFVLTRTDSSWGIFNETDLRFYQSNSNTSSPSSTKMVITTAGNVGIGTTSPTTWLNVYDTGSKTNTIDLTASGNSTRGHIGQFNNKLYISSNWYYNGSQNADSTSFGQAAIVFDTQNVSTGTHLEFQTSEIGATTPVERMRITSGGQVGIGTSDVSAVGSALVVAQSGTPNISTIRRLDASNTGSTRLFFQATNSGGTVQNVGFIESGLESSSTAGYLMFASNTTERMRITSGGNVGIGTTSPSQKLHVATSGISRITIQNTDNSSTGAGIQFLVTNGGTTVGNGTIRTDNGDTMQFFNNSIQTMAITSGGQIFMYALSSGAGTNTAKYSTATGQLTYDTSSARYKDNIRDSVYGLNDVLKMRSAMFEYKEDNRTDVGLIAEELYTIIPELVGIDKSGRPDSVSYDRLVSVLIKSVQELKAELDTLKNK